MIDSMNLDCLILPGDISAAKAVLSDALERARQQKQPVAVLVPPKTFAKPPSNTAISKLTVLGTDKSPTREEALRALLECGAMSQDDAVVATTGHININT